MAKTKQIFGQKIFELAMKATVYGQFVAGEDKERIKVNKFSTGHRVETSFGKLSSLISTFKPLVRRMDDVGVGSILDYAVEEDLEKSDAVELEMDACSSGLGYELLEKVVVSRHKTEFLTKPESNLTPIWSESSVTGALLKNKILEP